MNTEFSPLSAEWQVMRTLFDALPFYVLLVDDRHEILFANRAIMDVFDVSRDDLVGQYCPLAIHGLNHPYPGCPLEESVASGEPEVRELADEENDTWVISAVYPTDYEMEGERRLYVHFTYDITEQKRAERREKEIRERMFRTEKMQALGNFAAAITHDFRNVIMAVQGYAELARMSVSEDDAVQEDIRDIEAAAEQGAELANQLLLFARRESEELSTVDVAQLTRDVSGVLARLVAGEGVTLKAELDDELPTVRGSRGKMRQLITNLVVNARDAMPDGGTVTIRLQEVQMDASRAQSLGGDPGAYLQLSVSDTGVGIKDDVLDHIFEPFFTTKEPGEGTGLGLAIVYGVVEQHDGLIDVESEVGEGTTFHIYLPTCEAEEADA